MSSFQGEPRRRERGASRAGIVGGSRSHQGAQARAAGIPEGAEAGKRQVPVPFSGQRCWWQGGEDGQLVAMGAESQGQGHRGGRGWLWSRQLRRGRRERAWQAQGTWSLEATGALSSGHPPPLFLASMPLVHDVSHKLAQATCPNAFRPTVWPVSSPSPQGRRGEWEVSAA